MCSIGHKLKIAMSFVYYLALLGLSVTCYRFYKCIEILEYDAKPSMKKTLYKVIGWLLVIPALPYMLIFISLEMFEFKRHQKRHHEELVLVRFLSKLKTWPSKVECEIFGLSPISDYEQQDGDFEVWRERVYKELGL